MSNVALALIILALAVFGGAHVIANEVKRLRLSIKRIFELPKDLRK